MNPRKTITLVAARITARELRGELASLEATTKRRTSVMQRRLEEIERVLAAQLDEQPESSDDPFDYEAAYARELSAHGATIAEKNAIIEDLEAQLAELRGRASASSA